MVVMVRPEESRACFAVAAPRNGMDIFQLSGLKAGTQIEVVDEDRTIIAKNGKFSDEFAPLAEHVYRFRK